MTIKPYFLLLTILAITGLFIAGLFRLHIDTDMLRSLPKEDPVISDAVYLLMKHPVQDDIFIDIGLDRSDKDLLLKCGAELESELIKSGLFKKVGMADMQGLMPKMLSWILHNLPVLFSEQDLKYRIAPLLTPDKIHSKIKKIYLSLVGFKGIGQSNLFSVDPLGFNRTVLSRLSMLIPCRNVRIIRGHIVSPDFLHLLVIAKPKMAGTDTDFARQLTALIRNISDSLIRRYTNRETRISITPMGAYRAALDNELIVRKDVKKALALAMVGIALLLLLIFPRPCIGLLSLLPALMGTMAALFVYSLFYRSISVMVLGFGGAVISISVDYGISYMLFIDRPDTTHGKDASREVRSIGLIAVLTTAGAFLALCVSGFPVFVQLGVFTSLGIMFSFVFVHTVFPRVFETLPPARPRNVLLKKVILVLTRTGTKGLYVAILFVLVMLCFAKPHFDSRLESMNTVSADTMMAEKLFQKVWGRGESRVFMMTQGKTMENVQGKNDLLLSDLNRDAVRGTVASVFVPSMIFPGPTLQRQNFLAWKRFWNKKRVERVTREIVKASRGLGFSSDAFKPFFESLTIDACPVMDKNIPRDLLAFVHLYRDPVSNAWFSLSEITKGKTYHADKFYRYYSKICKIFDPSLFSGHLGHILFSTFMKVLIIVALGVLIMVFLFFLDLKLALVSISPVVFALVATLGTLNLIGHPIDIPGMMLAVVVFGMGIDYSLFMVRGYQRYRDPLHPYLELICISVFMSAASTMIGFGVLCFARHSLLKSAGLISLLGIGYSLMGAFLVLPSVLEHIFHQDDKKLPSKDFDLTKRVLWHYRKIEAYPRMFARFKLMLDPMFNDLADFFVPLPRPCRIMDIGIGYGVPACFLVEKFSDVFIHGIDPDPERVRVASLALGKRAEIKRGMAPDISVLNAPADVVMMLDMLHYLDDTALAKTLNMAHAALRSGGRLVIRTMMIKDKRFPWLMWTENLHLLITGGKAFYRSIDEIRRMVKRAGFVIVEDKPSGTGGELHWIVADAQI